VATRLGSVAGRETKRVTSAKTYSGNRGRNADIETVVARLADADLQLPVCQSTSMALLALVATLGLNWPTAKCVRATAETFHVGADAVSFLWPLTAVSQILLAATSPNSDSVRRVFDFFDEMAGLAMLFNPKRRLPDCIVENPRFLTLAIAAMKHRRLRGRKPRHFSDVELWTASAVFWSSVEIHREVLNAFTSKNIAKTCPYCFQLFPEMSRPFCSEACAASSRSAKHYQSNRDVLLPAKREEAKLSREVRRRAARRGKPGR
jgi:hypothetical protein